MTKTRSSPQYGDQIAQQTQIFQATQSVVAIRLLLIKRSKNKTIQMAMSTINSPLHCNANRSWDIRPAHFVPTNKHLRYTTWKNWQQEIQ